MSFAGCQMCLQGPDQGSAGGGAGGKPVGREGVWLNVRRSFVKNGTTATAGTPQEEIHRQQEEAPAWHWDPQPEAGGGRVRAGASGSPCDQAWGAEATAPSRAHRLPGLRHVARATATWGLGPISDPPGRRGVTSSGRPQRPRPFPGAPARAHGVKPPALCALSSEPSRAENGSLVTNMAPGHWVTRLFPSRHKGAFCSSPCPSPCAPRPPTHPTPASRPPAPLHPWAARSDRGLAVAPSPHRRPGRGWAWRPRPS